MWQRLSMIWFYPYPIGIIKQIHLGVCKTGYFELFWEPFFTNQVVWLHFLAPTMEWSCLCSCVVCFQGLVFFVEHNKFGTFPIFFVEPINQNVFRVRFFTAGKHTLRFTLALVSDEVDFCLTKNDSWGHSVRRWCCSSLLVSRFTQYSRKF